jgi:hypothetical protein
MFHFHIGDTESQKHQSVSTQPFSKEQKHTLLPRTRHMTINKHEGAKNTLKINWLKLQHASIWYILFAKQKESMHKAVNSSQLTSPKYFCTNSEPTTLIKAAVV